MQTTDYKHNVINLQMHFYQYSLIIEKAGHMHMQSRVCQHFGNMDLLLFQDKCSGLKQDCVGR